MKIYELFNRKEPVISFEIFPPKATFPVETIYKTIEGLKELQPAFISVTYGAGGSSSARTIEIADKVKNSYGIETVSHLTCVGSTKEQIDMTLDQLKAQGIENILALRGDPPAGQTSFVQPVNGYKYARDLVQHIKSRGQFGIAAAAYPEGHMECSSLEQDVAYLKEKVDEGVDFLITQLFFNNALFYSFKEKTQKAGIACPISVGIMPVLNASQIERITSLCGASIPEKLRKLLDKYGNNPADMEKAGLEYACEQILDLLSNRVDGIHLYTMNKAEQVKYIMQQIGLK